MRILALSDFHGKFSSKIRKIIKKKKIDLVVSIGDYPPFSIKKDFFKYVFGKEDVNLWDFIGKKEYKRKVIHDLKKAEEVIKKLNALPVPVISILGNHDWHRADDINDLKKPKSKGWKWEWDSIDHIKKFILKFKNITLVNYSYTKFGDFIFIGGRGHSNPGRVKSKAFKKHKKILEKLFIKFKKENKERKVILLYHNSPYNTKLDKITDKKAHKLVKNKHYGSKMTRRLIDKYHPVLSLSGHIEESRGQQKLGRTLAVNIGSVYEGHGVIIDLTKKREKIEVKFLRRL